MSVYVSKRNESKVEFLETAKKLSAHTLTYCLKAPKRLTFFLTKDICALGVRIDIWTHFMRGCIIDYVH